MPYPQATPRRSSRRRRALLVALGMLLALGAVLWWSAGDDDDAVDAPTSGGPVLPAPPAPATVAPAQPQEESATADEPPAPQAYTPALQSDDTDLSHARRAGLHEAPNPLLLTASAVVLADLASGDVYYARNDTAILPIASLTKLLTGLVLLESQVPLEATIRIAREDIDTLRNSRSRLRVGAALTRREALRLALMSSENRAAHALARTFPGGLAAFVSAMNAKARAIGMADSTFVDPAGLSNGNRATARDVARLVAAAARHPQLRSYSTTKRRTVAVGKQRLRYLNSNRLVRAGWPVRLQKTGYIVEAGQCMAMALRAGGRDVVMVLLDSGSRATRREDAQRVRRWFTRQAKEDGADKPGTGLTRLELPPR